MQGSSSLGLAVFFLFFGGKGKATKKDWASVARGLAARSPYDGGPRLESNEASLYEGSDDEL